MVLSLTPYDAPPPQMGRYLWFEQIQDGGHRHVEQISSGDISPTGRPIYFMYWIVQCFTSPPTPYRLYGTLFLQVKRSNQQYESTEGRSTKDKENNENN